MRNRRKQNPSEMRDSRGNSSASTGNHPTKEPCRTAVGPQKRRRRKQNHSEIRDDKKRRGGSCTHPTLFML
jgi:hypothetical protein